MSPRKILIADDNGNVARYLSHLLKKMGYDVIGMVTSSEDAIAKAQESQPDLLLMDARLAGKLDGIDTAAHIRSQKDIPVVYLLDQAINLDLERAIATAPHGYLREPFEEETARLVIEMALRQHDLEVQLRESEERFQMLVREAADGIILANPQGKLVMVNDAACKVMGMTATQMLGRDFGQLYPANDPNQKMPHMNELHRGQTLITERMITHKDGSMVAVESHSKILSNGEMQSMVRDITERKRLEKEVRQSDQRYRQLYETLRDGLVVVDLDLRYLECNQAFLDILGYASFDELRHKSYREITPQEHLLLEERVINDQILTRSYCDVYEKEYFRKDGSRVPVSVRGWMRHDANGQPDGIWFIMRDITFRKEAMEALQESERHFRELFDTSREGIAVTDMKAHILDCNPAFLSMLGYESVEELRQKSLSKIVPPEYAEIENRINREQVQVRGYSDDYEKEFFRKDGSRIPVNMGLWLRRDQNGQPAGVWAVARDITAQKTAEEALKLSEARYRTLFSQMMDGFGLHEIICDDQGRAVDYRFLEVNPILEKIIGIKASELIGKTVLQVLPRTEPVWIERYGQVALTGKPAHFSDHHQQLNKYFEVTAFSPQKNQFAVVVVDVSEQVKMQHTLEEERASLAKRVEERTVDLKIANMELAKASRMKDEFLASMSHELRTPLTGILGMSEALNHLVYGPINEKQNTALQNIQDSGNHLLALINDILDLSKVEAGKMDLDLKPVSLETICLASLRLVKQNAHKKQLKVSTTFDSSLGLILADEKRIKQIVVNLLGNAVKFTPDGGSIGINVRGDRPSGLIFITVWDTGIGIKKEDLGRLFAPFVQLDSSLARQFSGTGLGLSLVLRLVELHGGSINVESQKDAGSRFTVSLPWNEVPPGGEKEQIYQQTRSVPAVRQAVSGEDDPHASIEDLSRFLGQCRINRITVCSDTNEALQMAQEQQPDIILLDIHFSRQNDVKILKDLKDNEATSAIPVIVLSMVDEKPQGLAPGAADYLLKPISASRLQAAINLIYPLYPPRSALLVVPETNHPVVLLVEDNPINLTTIADFLQVKGFQVHMGTNGIEAIEKSLAVRPDIILMDNQMPVMDGLEATRRIRANPQTGHIPIVALTALAMSGDRELCFEAGVNDYLSKPLRLDQLQQVINRLLDKPGSE